MPRRFRLTSPPPLKENDVERQCCDIMRLRGYRPVRLQVGLFKTIDGRWNPVGEKGMPDWIAAHPTYPAIFVETKRPGRDLEPEQETKIAELRLWGLAVVKADNVDDFIRFLDEHQEKNKRAAAVATLTKLNTEVSITEDP